MAGTQNSLASLPPTILTLHHQSTLNTLKMWFLLTAALPRRIGEHGWWLLPGCRSLTCGLAVNVVYTVFVTGACVSLSPTALPTHARKLITGRLPTLDEWRSATADLTSPGMEPFVMRHSFSVPVSELIVSLSG